MLAGCAAKISSSIDNNWLRQKIFIPSFFHQAQNQQDDGTSGIDGHVKQKVRVHGRKTHEKRWAISTLDFGKITLPCMP
jgi:hypothetical protein